MERCIFNIHVFWLHSFVRSLGPSVPNLHLPSYKVFFKGELTVKQPLARTDLVDAVMASLHNPAAIGETYEALGPERMTQAELLTYMYALTSRTEEDLNFRYEVNIF